MAIEIGPSIIIGQGITVGLAAQTVTIFLVTEGDDNLITESGNIFITQGP